MDDPDSIPEASFIHGLNGIVQEFTSLYGMTELESSYLAFLMNIEGLAGSLINRWEEQGSKEDFRVHSDILGGLIETIEWVRGKAVELIDGSNVE